MIETEQGFETEQVFDTSERTHRQAYLSSYTAICLTSKIEGKSRGYVVELRQRWRQAWMIRRGFRPTFRDWYQTQWVHRWYWQIVRETVAAPFKFAYYLLVPNTTVHLLHWRNPEPAPEPTSR